MGIKFFKKGNKVTVDEALEQKNPLWKTSTGNYNIDDIESSLQKNIDQYFQAFSGYGNLKENDKSSIKTYIGSYLKDMREGKLNRGSLDYITTQELSNDVSSFRKNRKLDDNDYKIYALSILNTAINNANKVGNIAKGDVVFDPVKNTLQSLGFNNNINVIDLAREYGDWDEENKTYKGNENRLKRIVPKLQEYLKTFQSLSDDAKFEQLKQNANAPSQFRDWDSFRKTYNTLSNIDVNRVLTQEEIDALNSVGFKELFNTTLPLGQVLGGEQSTNQQPLTQNTQEEQNLNETSPYLITDEFYNPTTNTFDKEKLMKSMLDYYENSTNKYDKKYISEYQNNGNVLSRLFGFNTDPTNPNYADRDVIFNQDGSFSLLLKDGKNSYNLPLSFKVYNNGDNKQYAFQYDNKDIDFKNLNVVDLINSYIDKKEKEVLLDENGLRIGNSYYTYLINKGHTIKPDNTQLNNLSLIDFSPKLKEKDLKLLKEKLHTVVSHQQGGNITQRPMSGISRDPETISHDQLNIIGTLLDGFKRLYINKKDTKGLTGEALEKAILHNKSLDNKRREIVNNLNALVDRHKSLYKKWLGDRDPANINSYNHTFTDEEVKNYQRDFGNIWNNIFGYSDAGNFNDYTILFGTNNGRYVYPKGADTTDNPRDGWAPEGVYSAITDDRVPWGRVDLTSTDAVNNFAEDFKSYGLAHYFDEDGYGKIKIVDYLQPLKPKTSLLDVPTKVDPVKREIENKINKASTITGKAGVVNPLIKEPKYSNTIENIGITKEITKFINALSYNSNIPELPKKPLVDPIQLNTVNTQDYGIKSLAERQKGELISTSNNNLSSDFEKNKAFQLTAMLQGNKVQDNANNINIQKYNADRLRAEEVNNQNKKLISEAARLNKATDYDNRLSQLSRDELIRQSNYQSLTNFIEYGTNQLVNRLLRKYGNYGGIPVPKPDISSKKQGGRIESTRMRLEQQRALKEAEIENKRLEREFKKIDSLLKYMAEITKRRII